MGREGLLLPNLAHRALHLFYTRLVRTPRCVRHPEISAVVRCLLTSNVDSAKYTADVLSSQKWNAFTKARSAKNEAQPPPAPSPPPLVPTSTRQHTSSSTMSSVAICEESEGWGGGGD